MSYLGLLLLFTIPAWADCLSAIRFQPVIVVPEYQYIETLSNLSLPDLQKHGLGVRYQGQYEFIFQNQKIGPGDRVYLMTAFRWTYGRTKDWLYESATEMRSDSDEPHVWR